MTEPHPPEPTQQLGEPRARFVFRRRRRRRRTRAERRRGFV
ncbi:MAG TPA: hypothetical protein VFT98_15960 [Myxococcota bacterium]|nr:hypothetical protein [Myxococcota bacterium]